MHPADLPTLQRKLALHQRSARDFLDALVTLKLLERENGTYSNTVDTDLFLDRAKPSYIGGLLEQANARVYRFWGSLTEALRTGDASYRAPGTASAPSRSSVFAFVRYFDHLPWPHKDLAEALSTKMVIPRLSRLVIVVNRSPPWNDQR